MPSSPLAGSLASEHQAFQPLDYALIPMPRLPIHAISRCVFVLLAVLLSAACTPDEQPAPAEAQHAMPSGIWESTPVRLVRGDIDETYRFHLDFAVPMMDIVYHTTDTTVDARTIRQDLSITHNEGRLVLTGSLPRLVSGPAIIGTYAPDVLYCTPLTTGDDTLACAWGSDAHGEPPAVTLHRAHPVQQ